MFRMKTMFIFNYKASLSIITHHKQVIFFFKAGNFLLVPRYMLESWKPWDACDRQNYVRPDQLEFPFFFGVEVIYNVVLVLSVQQSESVMHVYISTLF